MEKEIEKLYLSILDSIDELIIKCTDQTCFDIGIFIASDLESNLKNLFELITNHNNLLEFTKFKKIEINIIQKDIYNKIETIPNLNTVYIRHLTLAESVYKNLNPKYENLKEEEEDEVDVKKEKEKAKERCNNACSYIHDKPLKKYATLQNQLEIIKSTYFNYLYTKKEKIFIIRVNENIKGVNNDNIKNFAKILKDKNHIDSDGEKNFIKLLKGEKPDSPIAWSGTTKNKEKAELSRLFNSMKEIEILVNQNIPWIKLEQCFTIDNTIVINLKGAANKKPTDSYSDELVKSGFNL